MAQKGVGANPATQGQQTPRTPAPEPASLKLSFVFIDGVGRGDTRGYPNSVNNLKFTSFRGVSMCRNGSFFKSYFYRFLCPG